MQDPSGPQSKGIFSEAVFGAAKVYPGFGDGDVAVSVQYRVALSGMRRCLIVILVSRPQTAAAARKARSEPDPERGSLLSSSSSGVGGGGGGGGGGGSSYPLPPSILYSSWNTSESDQPIYFDKVQDSHIPSLGFPTISTGSRR